MSILFQYQILRVQSHFAIVLKGRTNIHSDLLSLILHTSASYMRCLDKEQQKGQPLLCCLKTQY